MSHFGQSGYGMNANFEFNTPFDNSGKNDSNKGMFSSSSAASSNLSKPRMVKSRKSSNVRPMVSLETRKKDDVDVGFNPFRPVLNLNVASKVEKAGNELVDEIRKLRLEKQGDENGMPFELPDHLKKLNLGRGGSVSVSGGNGGVGGVGFGRGRNVGGFSGDGLGSELPNELKSLNIKDTSERGGVSFAFGGGGGSSGSDFVFGGNRKKDDSVVDGVGSILPDKIKSLNLDDPGRGNDAQKRTDADKNSMAFGSRNRSSGTSSGRVIDPMILDEMGKLKIRVGSVEGGKQTDADNPSVLRSEPQKNVGNNENRGFNGPEFASHVREQNNNSSGPQVLEDRSNKGSDHHNTFVTLASSFPSTDLRFPSVRGESQVPFVGGAEKETGCSFSGKHDGLGIPHVDFKTPGPKGNLFGVPNEKLKFNATESVKVKLPRGKRGKPKGPSSVMMPLGKKFTSRENSFQSDAEASESYSPMDISPYRETGDDLQSPKQQSFTSDDQKSGNFQSGLSNDAIDEDLISATESMDINKGNDVKNDEAGVQVAESSGPTCVRVDSFSAVETDNFESASSNLDVNGENEVESSPSCDQSQYFSASSSLSSGGSSFTFAASFSSQDQTSAAIRPHRKKNRLKSGLDVFIPPRNSVLSDTASSLQFSPIPRGAVAQSPVGLNNEVSGVSPKGVINTTVKSPTSKTLRGGVSDYFKKEVTSPIAAARLALEACEKWRLRGNQAYSNGDLEKAEEYYSQGLSCIPPNETARDCVRTLVLCYSNRAATRMSRGRIRDALQDCLVAAEVDPSFFRVQLRAANCYLALGHFGEASQYFKRLLQSDDVCVERKLILEASDGFQKSQKVYECMDLSTELLQRKSFSDAEKALSVIAEVIVVSPFSERLLESKAEALFMLRRYEEVILLCEQTMEAAEKNSPLLGTDVLTSNSEPSDLLKNYYFRIWRYRFIFKSNFFLGKLDEALDFLDKQENWRVMADKYGNEAVVSLIPQLCTARELIRYKSAGNAAFQAGRQAEAIEHYNSALSLKIESRPFAAVCFGNRAAAYQALGQITDAIADCSLAIALDGNYLKAISRRAGLFEMIRDYEQAAKDLQRLVSHLTKQAEEKTGQIGATSSSGSFTDLGHARQRLCLMEEQARKGLPFNFYLILGVDSSVTAVDLKKAYRKAALRHHPDKAGQSLARSESGEDGLWKEISEEVYKDADRLFKMIGEAYAVLSDPAKRSQYDIEEETRNGQRKSTSKMQSDASFHPADRGGGSGHQWREVWRSSANPYSRGFEPTRSSRYY